MTESSWKVQMMLFVRALDNTPENRQIIASIFSNNGSMETIANESRSFDSVVKLSTSGELPVQVIGIQTPLLLPDMRDAIRAFLDTLSQSRYYVVANYDLNSGAFAGKLLEDNRNPSLVGIAPFDSVAFTWQDALADLFNERGLQVIA